MKFLSILKGRAAIFFILLLSAISVFLYYNNNNKSHTIEIQKIEMATLKQSLEIERMNAVIYRELLEATNSVSNDVKEETKALRQSINNSLKELTRGNTNGEDKDVGSIRLDDHTIRVLSDLCRTVKGENCSPP